MEREAREHELPLKREAWEQQLQEERTARQKEHEARMQEQNEHKDESAYFNNVMSVSSFFQYLMMRFCNLQLNPST